MDMDPFNPSLVLDATLNQYNSDTKGLYECQSNQHHHHIKIAGATFLFIQ
jgi:hypothetical protein